MLYKVKVPTSFPDVLVVYIRVRYRVDRALLRSK